RERLVENPQQRDPLRCRQFVEVAARGYRGLDPGIPVERVELSLERFTEWTRRSRGNAKRVGQRSNPRLNRAETRLDVVTVAAQQATHASRRTRTSLDSMSSPNGALPRWPSQPQHAVGTDCSSFSTSR